MNVKLANEGYKTLWSHEEAVEALRRWMDDRAIADRDKYHIWYNTEILTLSGMGYQEIEDRFKPDFELYGYSSLKAFHEHLAISHEGLRVVSGILQHLFATASDELRSRGLSVVEVNHQFLPDHMVETSVVTTALSLVKG